MGCVWKTVIIKIITEVKAGVGIHRVLPPCPTPSPNLASCTWEELWVPKKWFEIQSAEARHLRLCVFVATIGRRRVAVTLLCVGSKELSLGLP